MYIKEIELYIHTTITTFSILYEHASRLQIDVSHNSLQMHTHTHTHTHSFTLYIQNHIVHGVGSTTVYNKKNGKCDTG